jgi:hypothetical protein
MNRFVRFQFEVAPLVVFMVVVGYGEKKDDLHYRLKVRVDPALHKLEAEAWIQQPPSSRFYLQKGFAIRQITADGNEVAFHEGSSPDSSRYAKMGTPIVVEAKNLQQLHVKYGGEMKEVVNEVNMIGVELVELALYSAWYPLYKGMIDYTFELEISMPVGFLTTTNGMQTRQWEEASRSVSTWTSYKPGWDMVLIASSQLQKLEGGVKDTQVEMYYHSLSAELLKSKIDSLVNGMSRLSDFYGPPQVKGVLRFVYSPRSGWGYSRIPLFVVSEEYAQEEMKKEYGKAKDFHGNCHEMAHFWWQVADTNTPDDWINEGLAEFSAFRLSEERFGKAFAEVLVREYRQHADKSQTSNSIAETESSSPDRYVNRYEKTTLLFQEVQHRFGKEVFDKVLKSLHTQFDGTHKLTTALFLEEVGNQMGNEARTFFHEALFRRNEPRAPAR